MKIAIWHNLPSGGAKRALYYQIKGLLEKGHTVKAWCPPTVNRTYLPLENLIEENIVPLDWRTRQPNWLLPSKFIAYSNTVYDLKALDQHCQICAEQINQEKFEILLAHNSIFLPATSIGKYVNIPKIIYLQEPYRKLYEASPNSPWSALPLSKEFILSPKYWKRIVGDLIEVQAARIRVREEISNAKAYDMILVNSRFSRESVLRAYGLESKVCYLGVDTELFRPTQLQRENFVVGMGSIGFNKGIDRAIRTIATIPLEKRPNLLWIGNVAYKTYQQEMEKLAKSLGVNFIPKVQLTDQEIVDILSRATVMLYTSRLEPFGFAPLEANACETPVVAIAEGGVRETIKDGINGIVIDDDNPTAIGQAVLNLLDNPELAGVMGIAARKRVIEKWTWSQSIETLEKYLLEAINLKLKNNE